MSGRRSTAEASSWTTPGVAAEATGVSWSVTPAANSATRTTLNATSSIATTLTKRVSGTTGSLARQIARVPASVIAA
jgi:hypothetical protein